MCGRFASSTPIAVLADQFMVAEIKAPERDASYNVAPTDEVYAVATRQGARRLGTLSWGLLPSWSKDASSSRRMVNLRAETVTGKQGFRRLLERRRCVIPADGFYEWKKMGEGRPKQPFFITSRDRRPLALAGLWAAWREPEDQDAEWLRTCTVITTAPNELVAPLHDRMPAILSEEAWEVWLDESEVDVEALSRLLVPYPPELLEIWPVGREVNSVANNGPGLVEPLEGHEPPLP